MVKNESAIIERCLSSIAHICDLCVITDTGSTDDTIVKAGFFLQKAKIPFKIYFEEFKDFGTNRTKLLQYCSNEKDITHVLMIDADEVLVCNPDFSAEKLKAELWANPIAIYDVPMKAGMLEYHLPRLTINDAGFEYVGVTHEYLDRKNLPSGSVNAFRIEQINDSHRRKTNQKFENDIVLMKKELETNLNLSDLLRNRYFFFIAQSLQALGEKKEAKMFYDTRLKWLEGWIEESYYCHYQIGQMLDEEGDVACIYHYMKAHELCPWRAEAIYNLTQCCYKNRMGTVGKMFEDQWREIRKPASGLFIEEEKYYDVAPVAVT
jgi:glycosyltransferase involved in cell wall biosynthesis